MKNIEKSLYVKFNKASGRALDGLISQAHHNTYTYSKSGDLLMRLGYGSGLAIAVLLAIVLYLFGVISALQSVSALLLLTGLWTVIYGLTMHVDKIYYIGWGAGIAVLSTFIVLPLAYAVALVLVVIIILIVVRANRRRGTRTE